MTSSTDQVRRRARVVTWTLVAGAAAGATAVAGVAAASTPGHTATEHAGHSGHIERSEHHDRHAVSRGDGNESEHGQDDSPTTPAPVQPRHHHRHHHQRARLAAPSSSQPSVTSSGS